VATKTSLFLLVKLLVVLCLCLGAAGGLLAQPQLTVTINGTLGPWIGGSGWITSAKYVSSPGFTATGAKGTFCVISFNGTNTAIAAARVTLSATNTPSVGTVTMLGYGSGYNGNPAPTAATAISSYTNPTTNKTTTPTATCSGTANVTTVVDDSVGLNGGTFTGTTTVDTVGISYTGATSSYPVSFNAAVPAFPSGLTCPNTTYTALPTATVVVGSGNDTVSLSGCTFAAAGGVTFSSDVALAGLPAAVPLAFPSTPLIASASSATYTPTGAGLTFLGDETILGISGAIASVCGTGANACPTESLSPAGPLAFAAVIGGVAPSPQSVTVNSSPTEAEAYAVTTSAGWLTVNGVPATGGQIGGSSGSFNIGVNPSGPGLVPGLNTGTVSVYTAASNSPQTVTVNLTLTLPNLVPSPGSFTFNSVNSSSPPSQTLSVTTSTNSNVAFTATPSSTGNWLSVSSTSGTTGITTITVSADPTKTSAGINSGFITLTSAGAANSGLQVPVTFNVTSVPTPSNLTFTGTAGGANPPTQPLSVTSTGPAVSYTAAVTSVSPWLSVAPGSGTTNGAAQTVSVNTAGLTSSGSPYSGTITVTPAGGAGIPVTVTLTLTSLPSMVPPASPPAFTSNAGAVPGSQTLTVTSSTSTAISYTVAASTNNGSGAWLQVAPSSGSTSGNVTVSINSSVLSGLATGTYTGQVVFTCSAGTCGNPSGQLSVPVTLTVTAALASLPASLTFNYTIGGGTPASQPITVTSNGAAITYTAVAATTTGGAWLAVSPGSATTSASSPGITGSVIAAALAGLTPNSYKGTITLTSAGATNSPFTIPATLVVAAEPTLQVSLNSLTFNMVGTGSLPAAQGLTVSASNGSSIPFNIAVATSGGSWLSAPASGNTSSGGISVSILANSLTPGTYNGTLTITSPQATGSAVVNVQLIVNSIALSPASITLNYQLGSSQNTVTQNLAVSSSLLPPVNLGFTATASVSTPTGGTWLSVGPTGGTTPANLTVTATPGALGVGSYSGTITVSSGGATFSVPVTLAIAALPSLTTAPNVLPFNFTIGGSLPANQTVTVGSNGAALSSVSASTTTPWLTIVSQSGTTTPFNVVVGLNAAGLASLTPGPYNGSVTITAQTGTASNSPLSYPVTLTVSAQPTLTVTPTPLTFSGMAGGANPSAQTLTVNGANGTIAFAAAASPSGTWLSVAPTSGSTNTTLQVSINTTGLAANTYNGSITVTSTTPGVLNSPTVIPVTLTLTANSLTASPTPLNFTYTLGGAAPAAQTLNVGSTIAGLSFTAAPGASWLAVTPASGTTPQALGVSIVTTGLTAGTYHANVTLTAAGAGNSPLTVPVNLTVNAEPSLIVNPTMLSLNYTTGGALPTGSVAVSTSNSASAAFSLSATTATGGNWLQFSPAGGTSPASFLVSIAPGSLTANTYTGTITVSAPGFTSATVAVTLVVTQPKAVIQITGNTFFSLANTGAPATSTLAISASDGSTQAFTIAAAPSQNNWLTLSPTSGTTGATPANVTLTANPAGLVPGIYVISVTVTMPALPVPTRTIQAELIVTGSNLAASPDMLAFTYTPGTVLTAQSISLTTASGSGSVALSSVKTDVPWLSVTPATSAPAVLQVSVNPGLLPSAAATGTYTGDVIVTGVGSPNSSLQIPVTVTVNAGVQLTATPAALTFNYQAGGALPPAQSFALASGGNAPLNFTATSPGSWITLSPQSGATPASVLVTANPAGLAPGTYGGTINVTAPGAKPLAVAVTLIVTAVPQLAIAPGQLIFVAPAGGPAPAAQTLAVTSTGAPLSFTAAAGSLWLGVTPTSGTTPATLSVSVNPTGLATGVYNGTINITQAGSAVPTMIVVTLQVGNVTPTIAGVINAASGAAGTIVPGMAISIFGSVLGPLTGVSFAAPPEGGAVAATLAGTQVLFDGAAVPVLYTSNGQVNALAPFELSNKANTVLTVMYNGATSAAMTLPVVASEPGLFTAAGTGVGEGSILNQDYSINSASHPAPAGSTVMLFGTGGGLTDPPSIDGTLNPIPAPGAPLGTLTQKVTATVGGQPADVLYAGPAPNLVVGVFQINVTIPSGTPSGNAAVVVQVGTVSSQTGVTIAVQ